MVHSSACNFLFGNLASLPERVCKTFFVFRLLLGLNSRHLRILRSNAPARYSVRVWGLGFGV